MRNWTGAALLSFAAWLFYSGLAHRNRILSARRDAAFIRDAGEPRADNRSLAVFGDVLRPIIIIALGYLALKAMLAYVLLDAGRFLSLFDLAGFLLLLTAYGTWLFFKTSYREVAGPITSVVPEATHRFAVAPVDDVAESSAERASEEKAREYVSPL